MPDNLKNNREENFEELTLEDTLNGSLDDTVETAQDTDEPKGDWSVRFNREPVTLTHRPHKDPLIVRFFKYLIPWKGDDTKEVTRKIVFLISVIVFIVCIAVLGSRFIKRYQSDNTFSSLTGMINEIDDNGENWDKIKAQYPDVDFPEGMNIKWAKLYAANQDFVGWLTIPGTSISFPIVQGKDNDEYLYLDYNRHDTNYGNPFMDYRCNSDTLSKNTIIYGHHMRDNMIFAPLKDYKDPAMFKKAPIIELSTLYGDYSFKIYGIFITNGYAAQNNGYVFNFMHTSFKNNDNFMEYIDQVDMRKLYTTGVDIKPTDKIITLNTCAYDFTEARLVLIGRMVRSGESKSVDTSLVRSSPNPLWPQAYYDKKKIENPHKNYKNWYLD